MIRSVAAEALNNNNNDYKWIRRYASSTAEDGGFDGTVGDRRNFQQAV